MTIACATQYIVNHLATPCRARSHQDVLYVKFMANFSIYNWIELSSTLPVKPGSSKLSSLSLCELPQRYSHFIYLKDFSCYGARLRGVSNHSRSSVM
ncbi:hypothetical protein M8J75_003417 [Diaphorina citri]|nr:hypothetical protein M8J75_003417 [Diaphorina citri]